ncbi:uncharacterized protein LOC107416686 isoform X2 [Ziziphus jujuba]|uniref:Uncharacterized protein LOC107416686 isoform X2 n=1 Tax=Ziziphus jujuba TaxID=326968 RepID=A0A6P6G2X5_ZIZJJ|nr:uncharacterized protein LOC107416686 isoform X2 [Ziziphus jujuba]XP_048327063.1 uncharacterized protein LOC107416686 isoform X2 [Ziziphus jujuba]
MNPTPGSSIFTDQGAGCLMRDQNAIFRAACAAPLKDCESITVAELTALHHGLEIAVTQGVDYLEVEGDHPIVFQLLQGQILPLSSSTETLLEECIQYFRRFRSLNIRQVKHSVNAVANKIATLSIGRVEPCYWFDKPPSEITELLLGDVVGRWVPISDL